MIAKNLTHENLRGLAADLLATGVRVLAPCAGGDAKANGKTAYRALQDASALRLPCEGLPAFSLKAALFPPTEPLLRWRQHKADIELEEVPSRFAPQVVLGARPCDAAGVAALDKVMGWDFRDELWFGRREATTIVTLACPGEDASCFCTAVGQGPDAREGSDLLLTPVSGGFLVEVLTERGEALVSAHPARFGEPAEGAAQEAGAFREAARAQVARNLADVEPAALSRWLGEHFEHPLWDDIALRCHGCGACASVCPTCHCFDIVDEPAGVDCGVRRRNWDTCQSAKFTVHASGHNPRATQHARFRQRVLHKFHIYPRRFETVLCTGCGRCARVCPGGMDLAEILGRIARLAGEAQAEAGGAT